MQSSLRSVFRATAFRTHNRTIFHVSSKTHLEETLVMVNDTTSAAMAHEQIQRGHFLLYQDGDYRNARQLLAALNRRFRKSFLAQTNIAQTLPAQWHQYRALQREQAAFANRLLLQVNRDKKIFTLNNVRRPPPHLSEVLNFAMTHTTEQKFVMPLRELLGMIGAHQWYQKGVFIPPLQATIHPHYGVFAPIRSDYWTLLVDDRTIPSPLNKDDAVVLMDVGIGTGVLSALLCQKQQITRLVGTDKNPAALSCARDNWNRLGLNVPLELHETHLFPDDPVQADWIICNPPWLPDDVANSWLDRAVYDDVEYAVLRGFLAGAKRSLKPNGEVWLVLSDLAELLGLRTRVQLMQWIDDGNLQVVEIHSITQAHRKTTKTKGKKKKGTSEFDLIEAARAAETTSLYRLRFK